MEVTASSEGAGECDPLQLVLHWFFHQFTQKNLCQRDLLKLQNLYKSTVFRSLHKNGLSLSCNISQEVLLLANEWVTSVLSQDVQSSPSPHRKQDPNILEVTSRLQKQLSSAPYVTSITYEEPIGNLRLFLNLQDVTGAIVKNGVNREWRTPGSSIKYQVQIVMSHSKEIDGCSGELSWMEYRKHLIAQGISKLLKLTGHQVDQLQYASLSNDSVDYNNLLVIGKEINNSGSTSTEELFASPDAILNETVREVTSDYRSIRELINERLSSISELKCTESLLSSWETSAQNLSKATFHFDILQKSLDTAVHLSRFSTIKNDSHSALFIMYNYARILSILKRFNEQVDKAAYPSLENISAVNFDKMCDTEEEAQLLQLLFEWPRILETAVNFVRFEINTFMIPKFLLAISRAFNNFYFEVAVLVPANAPHNFPNMMARIYLVQAICHVFQDSLDILQLAHAGV